MAGPSHVLPTAGSARFASPLGVSDFIKRTSIIEYDAPALAAQADDIERLTTVEELQGHGRAVTIRTQGIAQAMNLAATLRGTTYRFRDLKQVLAKANEEKSGDRLAGLAAESVSERVAAKRVLAEVTLQELYENPVVPPEQDAVTRLILDDLQRPIYDSVKSWTVAKLREHVLSDETDGAALLRLSRGLTERDDRRVREADDEHGSRVRGPEDPRRRAREQHPRAARPAVDPPAAQPPVGLDRGHPRLAARRAGRSATATRSSASTRSPTIPGRRRRS